MTPRFSYSLSFPLPGSFFSQGDNNGNSPMQILQFLKAVFFKKESVVF